MTECYSVEFFQQWICMYKKSTSILEHRDNSVKQKPLNSEFHMLACIHCYYHQLLKSRSRIILSLWNTVQCTMILVFSFIFITEMTRVFLSASENQELCRRFAHGLEFQKASTVHTRFRRIQITGLLFPWVEIREGQRVGDFNTA